MLTKEANAIIICLLLIHVNCYQKIIYDDLSELILHEM